MKEQKWPTLTLRGKTDSGKTETSHSASEDNGEPVIKVARKKSIVVSSPPDWKVKKQMLERKAQDIRKAEEERLLTEHQVDKCNSDPVPVYRKDMELQEALSLLQAYWPALVENDRPQLLAVNIRQAMLNDKNQRGLDLSTKKLKRCLTAITRSDIYLDSMTVGAWRKHIDGQPVAEISDDEAAFALERKAREHARLSRKNALKQKHAG